jgi:hypothetical protein
LFSTFVIVKQSDMKTNEKALWEKISDFRTDDDNASFKFSQRLARENGWSLAYAKRVIDEYKKFIFLCCITDKMVTPSDQVDQAWHLHLTYTRSYWVDLCRNTIVREIHHNPTKGGKDEGEKFDDCYTHTLKLYKEKFGSDPPGDIWPQNDERFSDIDFERVNRKKFWIIPKPAANSRVFLWPLVVMLFIMQACTDGDGIFGGVVVIWFSLVAIAAYNQKKGGGGSSGSGCGGGSCGGDSGCSSGCGSGCSGCGGGGCGGCGS